MNYVGQPPPGGPVPAAATNAEVLAGVVADKYVSPATLKTFSRGDADVWVSFNGTGVVAIRDSFNVSSITDIGTGIYDVNYAVPFANISYAALTIGGGYSGALAGKVYDEQYIRTTGKCSLANFNSSFALTDPPFVAFAAYGDNNATVPPAVPPVQAWVNFNGTGIVAIRASYNVASITDNGTGDYTINFTTPLSNANYAVTAGPSQRVSDNFIGIPVKTEATPPTVNGFRERVYATNGTIGDYPYVDLSVAGT